MLHFIDYTPGSAAESLTSCTSTRLTPLRRFLLPLRNYAIRYDPGGVSHCLSPDCDLTSFAVKVCKHGVAIGRVTCSESAARDRQR